MKRRKNFLKREQNIIDEVLNEQRFTKDEMNKFKKMLTTITENKKYGFHRNLKSELISIIERDDNNADKKGII